MKKIPEFFVLSLILVSVMSVLFSSCSTDNYDSDNSEGISDQNFYGFIGTAIIRCYTDIYNQNLAGQQTGTKNITVDGPMGGTVTITGTTGYDSKHDISTTDLLFSMTEIKYVYSYQNSNGKTAKTELTLTGNTTYVGSFSDDYTSISHKSENLHITGSVTYEGSVRTIDTTGEVIINRSDTTSVDIFGNVVSW